MFHMRYFLPTLLFPLQQYIAQVFHIMIHIRLKYFITKNECSKKNLKKRGQDKSVVVVVVDDVCCCCCCVSWERGV